MTEEGGAGPDTDPHDDVDDDRPQRPDRDAPGNFVDDPDASDVPEPNEPG